MTPKNRRICLLGASLETTNRGVSALSAATCRLFVDYLSPCEITLLVPARISPRRRRVIGTNGLITVEVLGFCRGPVNGLRNSVVVALFAAICYRVLPVRRVREFIVASIPLLRVIHQSDIVADLFAGDSFSDIYGFGRLCFRAVPCWCVALLKKPYILLPQTYGPFKHRVSRKIAASIISHATMAFTRTQNDSTLSNLSIPTSKRLEYCPDVAFALVPSPAYGEMVRGGSNDSRPVVVGLNISALLYVGGYNRNNMFGLKMDYVGFADGLISALLQFDHLHVVLIPHTYSVANLDDIENDLGACLKVAAKCSVDQGRLTVIRQALDQHQIKGAIGGCDFFIGSRLHSCIAALSQHVVTVGVGYSKKFVETFSTVGMEDLVIDGRTTGNAEAIEKVIGFLSSRYSYQSRLKAGVERNQEIIQQSFELIRQTIDTPTQVDGACVPSYKG